MHPLSTKKSRNLLAHKKSRNLSVQQKIMQPLGTIKYYATSQHTKKIMGKSTNYQIGEQTLYKNCQYFAY